jgi:hypothetical protein
MEAIRNSSYNLFYHLNRNEKSQHPKAGNPFSEGFTARLAKKAKALYADNAWTLSLHEIR